MFSINLKRKRIVLPVVDKVAEHITQELQSPYTYAYGGNIRYKIERETVISEKKAAVFKQAVVKTVSELLDYSGYVQIKGDGQLMKRLLGEYDIEGFQDRLDGDIWFIEDNQDAYFYAAGMKAAKRI